MRQVLRSRQLEGRLLDFSPGRKSQYEIWAKLAKEILASKVRKEERRKELIINLLAILSFWMLKAFIMLTKECHLWVLIHFNSLIISTVFTSVFQLLFYLNYLPLYVCMETEFFCTVCYSSRTTGYWEKKFMWTGLVCLKITISPVISLQK